MENWILLNNREKYNSINNPNFSSLQKVILANRDVYTNNDLEFILNPTIDNLHSPFHMRDLDKALDIIFEHIRNNKNIKIVGDYDQDGIAATTILLKGLSKYTQNISYSIPDRIEDGYGINKSIIDSCIEENISLIITCDNGISAFDAIEYAKSKGLDVIVTDHHEVVQKDGNDILPIANAVINPHRKDCDYPFKNICGAVVSYKLIVGMFEKYGIKLGLNKKSLHELLQYAALGTVCDVMPLINENRAITVLGISELNTNPNKGIKIFLDLISWNKPVSIYTIGFLIGPAINSSGRIYTANLGVELLNDNDSMSISIYAKKLIELNNERKELTLEATELAISRIINENLLKNDIIILYENSIHESICGLVAGRVKERFNKPTIILTDSSEEGYIKGSGRSIEAYDMFTNLDSFRYMFRSFGGHKMACGLTFERKDLNKFITDINNSSNLKQSDFNKNYYIDAALNFNHISFKTIDEIYSLDPFGNGFSEPIFATKNVNINSVKVLGKNNNVLKFYLEQNNKYFEAISFNVNEVINKLSKFNISSIDDFYRLENKQIDILYKLEINEYNGNKKIQLKIESMR